MPLDAAALEGRTLGPWTVGKRLGQGAMGAVYRAHRTGKPDEVAALKVMREGISRDDTARQRFLREAKALLRIDHPGCCRCLGHGEDQGLLWLALELVSGQTLEQVLKIRGKLAPEEARPLVAGLLRGLEAAHAAGVVHRDVKPANAILVGEKRVVLVDFGLARRREESMLLTAEGTLLGTPYYMSPEQCAGEATDARSDLYAAGAVAFHLLAGRPPFQGKSVTEVLKKHLHEPPPALEAPPGLAKFVARCLEKEPAARFPDASAALAALEERAARPPLATPERPPPVASAPAPTPTLVRGAALPAPPAGSALDAWLIPAIGLILGVGLALGAVVVIVPSGSRSLPLLLAVSAGAWLGLALGRGRAPPKKAVPTLFLAKELLARGDARGAAQSFHALGQLEDAAQAWEAAGEPARAAELLAERKPHEAARLFEAARQPRKAVECLRRAGDLEGAAASLERQGLREEAVRLLVERAAELEARRGREKLATRLARIDADLARIVERASELHRELGSPAEGARLLERIGRNKDAAGLYLEAGEREAAASAFLAAGDPVRARELHERAGDVIAAARITAEQLLARGDKRGAAGTLEKAGDAARAGPLWEELGETLRAAELFVRAGERERAATLFERAGKQHRAAELRRPPDATPASGAPPAATAGDEPSAWVGRTVDRYRIVDHLGSGAFAHVFRAEHVHLERPAALKLLKLEWLGKAGLRERFLGEAKLVARVRHPAVVELWDFGEVEGRPYMALELVEGETLGEVLRARGPLPQDEVVGLTVQLCEGVGAAHAAGVVHRDLKPENVLLDRKGRVRVLDFGLARVFWGVASDAPGARGGGFAGTPRYAPPEAAQGEVDARGDQYALGLIAYELASGRSPFHSDTLLGWLGQHQSAVPPPPSSFRAELSPGFDRAVLRALEKRPDARHPDLAAFAAALRSA